MRVCVWYLHLCLNTHKRRMNITININAPVHNLTIVNDDQDKAKELAKELAKANELEDKVGKALLKVLNIPLDLQLTIS